ncbi:hypothetical protein P2Q00_45670 [Streptomyces coacervatus]|uniref:hypothetical protein n=1 Tax=Streptomyces coacervatus TaxID=647381 RepID=UPI0023DC3482|nr:hypothetical protein [Streptomyces coacervatus]MDF2272635.1 hypothetical protein [Streptomyces coacervatus]
MAGSVAGGGPTTDREDDRMDAVRGQRRTDWVQQLQDGTLPHSIDPLDELHRLAADLDPADSLAVFANVDVPEIDIADDAAPTILPAT